ncbi:MAG TPA: short chain dehydrogenase [Halieaceae bacterium]|jgi:NAD(P)-dependent dehydrogenase (short-subunit alcohol dehydrogenase family)|uniref:SDR family oxidoreductase n=1 Tax=Haliea TaxID=475794 RepID=UPI000C4D6053|nr:SDR family oxidoreductase [Haliea sp.]HAN68967.1 short chain dehydrogenase [Halieaceae bacterium]MAD63393.1 short chain dehydrogenase [Haliea sp.]MAY93540.1 short chain dehydrogenase [Haliea sp.]MBK41299.1 short chain dehydrogenase [Haliea sp.]MBP71856.1 short chain dehydrogenase [Haliea sp.]|tara:strand:+ start:3260 stop:4042 length:783 start_codon:yes stop_codon:yes gene_type:complete
MQNPLDFNGRVVLVTGGGKGVGRGISERFMAAGAEVAICGRNPPEQLPAAGGREAFFVACDVRKYEQLEAMVDAVVARFGRLDVLVNNAGGAPEAEAATVSPRFHESIIALNLTSALHAAQLANRVMQAQPSGGSIINIASVSTIRPSPGTAAYGAAKAGLVNLGQSLAVEWGPLVRINAIIAGLVETEQAHLHYGDADGVAAVGRTIPLGRMAVPEDIGDTCLFLASPLASYISGTSIAVHGGGEKPAFLQAANTTSAS